MPSATQCRHADDGSAPAPGWKPIAWPHSAHERATCIPARTRRWHRPEEARSVPASSVTSIPRVYGSGWFSFRAAHPAGSYGNQFDSDWLNAFASCTATGAYIARA